jgi:septum formation protein
MIEKIILASASPRRKEILQMLRIPFTVEESGASEETETQMPPAELVCELARRKCMDVKQRLEKRGEDISRTLIIGCDTVVCYDGMAIGKPPDDFHAMLTLGVLSDSWHSVYSGLALCLGGECDVRSARTDVKFREITEREIEKYVASGEPRGKAGSYAIQLMGASFAERIEGDYYNIVGLPVSLFTRMLADRGVQICDITEY